MYVLVKTASLRFLWSGELWGFEFVSVLCAERPEWLLACRSTDVSSAELGGVRTVCVARCSSCMMPRSRDALRGALGVYRPVCDVIRTL